MRLLVDTHLLLWAAVKSRRLPKEARRLLEDPANEVLFSAASLWEVVIKTALHKPDFRVDVDSMLVAQSLAEPLVLLTNDGVLADYGDVVKVV